MDSVYSLLGAISTGNDIQLVNDGDKKTIFASVNSCSIYVDHNRGTFEGSVNYQIENEPIVKTDSIWSMWVSGWEARS